MLACDRYEAVAEQAHAEESNSNRSQIVKYKRVERGKSVIN